MIKYLMSNCFDLLWYVIYTEVINFVFEDSNTCYYVWNDVSSENMLRSLQINSFKEEINDDSNDVIIIAIVVIKYFNGKSR